MMKIKCYESTLIALHLTIFILLFDMEIDLAGVEFLERSTCPGSISQSRIFPASVYFLIITDSSNTSHAQASA